MFPDQHDIEIMRDSGPPNRSPSQAVRDRARAVVMAQAASALRTGAGPTQQPPRWRRSRTRLAILGLAATFGIGAPVAVAVGIGQHGENSVPMTSGILCADNVSKQPSGTVITSNGRPPEEQCAALGPEYQGPPRVACVSPGGATFVYRAGPSVCVELGMQPLVGHSPGKSGAS
jgi:hypothetical protein